ncbi:hypothetical protein F5Y12DRAFT_472278 [Xylaria sp. FL1777]|nr:hypothetical protein F5Y12DRAFT_472278 [Xylaria sp. FL1777]
MSPSLCIPPCETDTQTRPVAETVPRDHSRGKSFVGTKVSERGRKRKRDSGKKGQSGRRNSFHAYLISSCTQYTYTNKSPISDGGCMCVWYVRLKSEETVVRRLPVRAPRRERGFSPLVDRLVTKADAAFLLRREWNFQRDGPTQLGRRAENERRDIILLSFSVSLCVCVSFFFTLPSPPTDFRNFHIQHLHESRI